MHLYCTYGRYCSSDDAFFLLLVYLIRFFVVAICAENDLSRRFRGF